jgi:hypothetical protein
MTPNQVQEFKDARVGRAIESFDEAQRAAADAYEKVMTPAAVKALSIMEVAEKEALKRGDLDEATKIRKSSRQVEVDAVGPKFSIRFPIIGVFHGKHADWESDVIIRKDGTFNRIVADGKQGDGGSWERSGETMVLRWKNYAPETIQISQAFSGGSLSLTWSRPYVKDE